MQNYVFMISNDIFKKTSDSAKRLRRRSDRRKTNLCLIKKIQYSGRRKSEHFYFTRNIIIVDCFKNYKFA